MSKNICSHKFEKDEKKSCKLDEFFSQMRLKGVGSPDKLLYLPHDAIGECIFHSQDLEWKRENNFMDWLKKLIFLSDKYDDENDEIELDEVIFVGNSLLEEQEFKHKIRADSENELYCIKLENTFCNKSIVLNNAKFEDIIILERCCLKKDLVLQSCCFSKGISINHITIGGDFHIYNSHFQKRIIITNDNNKRNTVYDGWYIEDSIIIGDSSFSDFTIKGSCIINNNKFEHKKTDISFNCHFLYGLEFLGNSVTNIGFSSCEFYYDNIFSEIKLLGKFSMFTPRIGGQLKFVGNNNNLLFNPQTTIEVTSECFEENGMITFDYCNLLDLGTIFIENCRNLEAMQKIRILPSCKVDRLTIIRDYQPYTELASNIIEDYVHIVSRYFRRWHSINLSVDVIRNREAKLIRIVFKTTDDITEKHFESLLKIFPVIVQEVNDKEYEKKDIQNALYDLLKRIIIIPNYVLSELKKEEILILQDKKNININMIMGNYIKELGVLVEGKGNIVENNVIKQISEVSVIDNSTVNNDSGKKKSLWKKIIIGVVIAVMASAIWYFMQKIIEY